MWNFWGSSNRSLISLIWIPPHLIYYEYQSVYIALVCVQRYSSCNIHSFNILILYNSFCFGSQICVNCCCEAFLRGLHIPKNISKPTIVYAKFQWGGREGGGQTEWIMGNWKILNTKGEFFQAVQDYQFPWVTIYNGFSLWT